MTGILEFIEHFSRYLFIAVAVYIAVRILIAMFSKKTSYPERGRLVNTVTGEQISLYENEISIGRNKFCDLVLGFDTISRLHAVLAFRNRGFVVFDTNSKAGVTLNGERISKKANLVDGDVVGFGGLEYVLQTEKYKYIKDKSRRTGRPPYGLIMILLTVFNLFAMLINMFPSGKFSPMILAVYVGYIGLMWLYMAFSSFVMRINNYELEMLAFLFCSLGLAIVGNVYPESVVKQLLAVVIGVVGYCVLTMILRHLDFVKKLRWPIAAVAIGLLGITLVIAKPNNGALSWISLGGVSLQPSELVKVAFIFVGAVTLERLQSVRHLTAYMIFAAACVGELFLMYDFGAALIFFFTFIIIAFMRSGDIRTIMLICIAAALGAGLILVFKPYVASRFATYTHVWEYMDEGGYQQTRTLIYSASGGLFGLGLGNGALRDVFAATEDLVFGVVCEEFGAIMAFLIPVTYAAVTAVTVINAQKSKSTFYAIASVAASAMMLFQSMLSIFGITDLLPLTGVTLPFISKGGSSIISCFLLLAYIKSADVRTYASFKPELDAERGNADEINS